jgi:CCR4-NOT transcriptional complex subunit CAF120
MSTGLPRDSRSESRPGQGPGPGTGQNRGYSPQRAPRRSSPLSSSVELPPHWPQPAPNGNSAGNDMSPQSSTETSKRRPSVLTKEHLRNSSIFSFRSSHKSHHSVETVPSQAARPTNGADEFGRSGSPGSQKSQTLTQNTITASNSGSQALQRAGSVAVVPSLHPEIRSIVNLTVAHAHKVYYSGPLVRRIERLVDGGKPSRDEGWTDVWAQLGGTTLSIWDMKKIDEANKQGREVPPTYLNMTDAVSL